MKENIPQTPGPAQLENTSFHDGVQFAFDSTSIKLAETCFRKYQYEMIDHHMAKDRSVHLVFGGLYASALEHYHKHRAAGVDHDFALELVVAEALRDSWDHEAGKPMEFLHNTKTRENLIRTIVWYLEEFKNDTTRTALYDGVPAVEYSFSFQADNDIMFAGHIDRIVEYGDFMYIMDQKTTGSTIGSSYFEQYNLDSQMSLYTLAGRIVYHLPVKGVIVDAAQIAVGFSRFARGFTHRTEGQLTEWYDNTMKLIEQVQAATRNNEFRMNFSSCNNFGGCAFRGVCSRSPEVRKNFLEGDFTQSRVWDPLKRR
jgi:hypothetical protein